MRRSILGCFIPAMIKKSLLAEQEQSLRLLDRDGAEVNSKKSKLQSPSEDGSTAVEVQIVDSNGHISR